MSDFVSYTCYKPLIWTNQRYTDSPLDVPKRKSFPNLFSPITVLQFFLGVWGFVLDLVNVTLYTVYFVYIVFYLLPFFFYWHKLLQFVMQSVWKGLTHGEKNASQSQCLLRKKKKEDAFIWSFFKIHFSLESDETGIHTLWYWTVQSKPEHCGAGFQ